MGLFGARLTCEASAAKTKPVGGNLQLKYLSSLPGITVSGKGHVKVSGVYPPILSSAQLDAFARSIASQTGTTPNHEIHTLIYDDDGILKSSEPLKIPSMGGASNYSCMYGAQIDWAQVRAIWHTHPLATGLRARRDNRDFSYLSPGDAYTCLKLTKPIFMLSPCGNILSVLEHLSGELRVRVLMGTGAGTVMTFDANP